ncbi:MAG: aldo/keto reductase [Candidatus Hydrogenedentes bacterium]|nr:aldo/keto reductase [Candidatus Hydrogenedentota bacterium]
MSAPKKGNSMDRRDFMKTTAAVAIAGAAVATATNAVGPNRVLANDGLDHRNERPDKMAYRKLGNTNFMCSRLVFGCGAALMGGRAVRLLEVAFENGVNHYDVGFDDYYKGSEKHLGEFLKTHRDDVWVTSKAPVRRGMGLTDDKFTVQMAKEDAEYWSRELDKSLGRLDIEYVDAYYQMAVGNPDAVASEEMYSAFSAAKDAGKVGFYGISTHKRAEKCLVAAMESGWHSLAMIAITPGGWYDWDSKQLLAGTSNLKSLRPVLDRAREAGIGLVGMKAARFIAPATALGKGDSSALDSFYDEAFLKAPLSPFQRSYAFVLENGIDVMNSDMQNFKHFEENLIAAKTSHEYFA